MKSRYIVILLAMMISAATFAQRRITPVKSQTSKIEIPTDLAVDTVKKRPESVVEVAGTNGRIILVDTLSGKEYTDTILTVAPKLVFPRWESIAAGVNLWDPLMRCFGQHYGLIGFWGEVSIHNWIKPYVEIGLGNASYTPDRSNFTYKSGIAPYFKIGANYNFLYNSNPAYSVYAGLRYGITNFSYEVTDVSVYPGYWDEDISMSVPSQRVTTGYFEVALGLRVMIASNIALGWEVKVHNIIHSSKAEYGDAWYVPGFGTRGSLFTGALSISYTLPFPESKRKRKDIVDSAVTPTKSGSAVSDEAVERPVAKDNPEEE